jgi:hypothetical protein
VVVKLEQQSEIATARRGRRVPRWLPPVLALVAIVGGVAAMRGLALRGLPDVGHPFDVEKYGTIDVPDDRNAYVEYINATKMMTRNSAVKLADEMDKLAKEGWGTASPELTEWLEANRPALLAWRKGTEKPDAFLIQPKTYTIMTGLGTVQDLRNLARLAVLEGRRLESEGKMAEAWGWYRALLRSSRHIGRHGCLVERLVGIAIHAVTADRIITWAADPRVDTKLLRQALDDVIAADALTAPTSDGLKAEYFTLMSTLDDPASMRLVLAGSPSPGGSSTEEILHWLRDRYSGGVALSRQEPERSRRVIRLVWANWLAYCDLPRSKQPPTSTELRLYQAMSDAPPAARALAPEALLRWFDTTVYAKPLLPAIESVDKAVARERSKQATLVFFLAEQLYRRDHGGQAPPNPSALVGPYLKALPDQPAEAPR